MGKYDDLINHLTAGKDQLAGAPKHLVESTLELIDKEKGGLQGLADKLKASGLGEQVQSWIGTGPNKSISPDQIKQSLGSGEIERLALKTKLSVEEVTSHLAAALPQIVDKLTPEGKVTAADLKQHAQSVLNKFGFRKKQV